MKRDRKYSSGKIDWVRLEDLKLSEKAIGQIYPVVKTSSGKTIDGEHRKRANPNWKEIILPIEDELESLKLRVHLNIIRRDIEAGEKSEWIQSARRLLKDRLGREPTQEEIAEALGMKHSWVMKWDPVEHWSWDNKSYGVRFFGYNVWGFKDESWRKLIIPGDPNQPDKEEYHGHTPSFVIHQLIRMFQPKTVLDSMAGVGTMGYVCKQYGIKCDQYDLYPYSKYDVYEGDAETIEPSRTYDLIFNHIPYLRMFKYGDHPQDLSKMDENHFYNKLKRIFEKNLQLLNKDGVYAVLVGDWRSGGQLNPITAKTALIGLEAGFKLHDEAIKLTGEMESKSLQEYRAAKGGYLAQTYDTVLMFTRDKI
jgi:hypothetical protein